MNYASTSAEQNSTRTTQSSNWAVSLLLLAAFSLTLTIGFYLNRRNKAERQKSLRDIKSYVRCKLDLDNEDKKLSKLMESVIPKHLAGKMRHDILCPTNKIGNFYPIYLTAYDNVSILFADIVNFTKISSNCSAQLLVETLNELFGRFDKQADMRQCLRIKILGDCYYCVSGIPNQKQAHARQSVEMGLDMIDILGDLAQGDNQGVDLNMRVGIHTGRVLCGVLGKKKWQFDVHSNDVKLANHTEQSGIAGRVHITEDTLRALEGRYDVERANGHLRDTYIAQRNVATYFVIPPPERRRNSLSSSKLMGLGSNVSASAATQAPAISMAPATTQQVIEAGDRGHNGGSVAEENSNLAARVAAAAGAPPKKQPGRYSPHGENHHQPREIPGEEGDQVAGNGEESGRGGIGSVSRGPPSAPASIQLAGDASKATVDSAVALVAYQHHHHQQQQKSQASGSAARSLSRPPTVLAARQRFRQTTQRIINALHFIRTIDAPFANLDCQPSIANLDKMTQDAINARSQIKDINKLTLRFKDKQMSRVYMNELGWSCLLRAILLYLTAFLSLILLIYSQTLSYYDEEHYEPENGLLGPSALERALPIGFGQQLAANSTITKHNQHTTIDWHPDKHLRQHYDQKPEAHLIAAIFIALFLFATLVYGHRVELLARRNFIWRQVALSDKEQMARVRDCNKFIFFNLLPPHVATYFLEQKNVGHMDLYHRSYNLTGVMFATVSNFSDFYSEIQGNNHGLDCLRLLNEIICDFDLLLDDKRFSAIDKIKTIGSTYMAAIGLFPDHELPSTSEDTAAAAAAPPPQAQRQEIAHYLRILLHFIHEMKLCLEGINQHSYNNFKLRVGVNLGPVTAGVIGATKPQYDIWGNTVNVASRMESTCEANRIQVTEEVYAYLKEDQRLQFTCRGRIDVKGKGSMTTYYVEVLT